MVKPQEGQQITHAKVDDLHLDPANVRRHPDKNLDAIKASLVRFGQQKPIVVNADNVVIAGNGTLAAARALGWATIQVVRSDLAGVDATAYAIADNRTAELAEWDDQALAETLRAIQSDPSIDVAVTGYNNDEVDSLIARLAADIVPDFQPASEDEQGRLDEKAKVECPECGHFFSP
jgi:ParB-like chromosome segregation protein Spo0J